MHEALDAKATTGGDVLPDNLRRHGAVVGGVAAGLVVLGLAAYTFGAAKSTTLLGASECEVQPISIGLGQHAEATMTVSPRTQCQIATGPIAASIEEFTIVDPPKHGTLMHRGGTGMVYQSNGNFRGQDSFAFAMRGKTDDAYAGTIGGTSVVRAYVTVK